MDDLFHDEINRLHTKVCRALSEPKRISLLYLLADGPKSVTELVAQSGFYQSTISRHLQVLRRSELVRTQRQGTFIYYSLSDQRVIQALDLLRAVLVSRMNDPEQNP